MGEPKAINISGFWLNAWKIIPVTVVSTNLVRKSHGKSPKGTCDWGYPILYIHYYIIYVYIYIYIQRCGVAKQLLSYKCDDFASRGTDIHFPMEDAAVRIPHNVCSPFWGFLRMDDQNERSRFQH